MAQITDVPAEGGLQMHLAQCNAIHMSLPVTVRMLHSWHLWKAAPDQARSVQNVVHINQALQHCIVAILTF